MEQLKPLEIMQAEGALRRARSILSPGRIEDLITSETVLPKYDRSGWLEKLVRDGIANEKSFQEIAAGRLEKAERLREIARASERAAIEAAQLAFGRACLNAQAWCETAKLAYDNACAVAEKAREDAFARIESNPDLRVQAPSKVNGHSLRSSAKRARE